ncbi:uncharacterized protein [Pagrus major]|uniref:uncharacterized protein n=1 Tax=Pagrus major TaxID=143350 RepID=UPI003CC8A798
MGKGASPARLRGCGRIGCEHPPPIDQSMAALMSPAGSALGPTSCPNRNSVKEQAVAAGKVIASLWVARRHLWLMQSRFQPADHTSLTGLPIEPTAVFGSGVLTMLQQAQEARRYAIGAQETLGSSWFVGGDRHYSSRAGVEGPAGARADSLHPAPDGVPSPSYPDPQPGGAEAWAALGANPWVLSTMTQGYQLQFYANPHCQYVGLSPQYEASTTGVIREVEKADHQVRFLSHYFLIPKRDGSLRPVLDLRGLNRYLRPLRCKMLTVPRVRQAINQGDWFATVDLKDAYFQKPIWRGHWHFLRFQSGDRTYEFIVLPFGISLAPRTFTRCMDAVLGPLHRQGFRVLNYLDNWLVCAQTQQMCCNHISRSLRHIKKLGLQINEKKSDLEPSQVTQFLGMTLDSRAASISLIAQRREAIRAYLRHFRLNTRVSWRLCLCLMGLMATTVQIVSLGLLHMQPVQRCLLSLGLRPQSPLSTKVWVTQRLYVALRWWSHPQNLGRGNSLGPVMHQQILATDASQAGWGAVHAGLGVRGAWTGKQLKQHINALKLQAIHLALLQFLPRLQGCHVLVRTDSTVAAAYVNRQRGLSSPHLGQLAHELWTLAYPRFLSLRATYLLGPLNTAADLLSRGGPQPGEWRLHTEVVVQIWHRFGMAVADLFASRETAHCPMFYSLGRDNPPLGTDALAHQWPQGLLYAFPPFSLLRHLLWRIRLGDAAVILVAPNWPHMPWFSEIAPLLNETPWELSRRDLLLQAQGPLFHPFLQGQKLWAWPLKGQKSGP